VDTGMPSLYGSPVFFTFKLFFMKYFLFIVGVLFMVGCNGQPKQKSKLDKAFDCDTVELYGCQYIVYKAYSSYGITHKGNCKFCAERNKPKSILDGAMGTSDIPLTDTIGTWKFGGCIVNRMPLESKWIDADKAIRGVNFTIDSTKNWPTDSKSGVGRPATEASKGETTTPDGKIDWSKQRNDNTWASKDSIK